MAGRIPDTTINAFARSIFHESKKYGFSRVDLVRLINALVDLSVDPRNVYRSFEPGVAQAVALPINDPRLDVSGFPLRGDRVKIRQGDAATDLALLESWLDDRYGEHFLLSCATAQRTDPRLLFENPGNHIGLVLDPEDAPIGVVAFLDHDRAQRRAELRKMIGVPAARGRGYAERATALWLKYGVERLGLEKIFVSTLQTHLRNIQVNEALGFRVEGVLIDEVLIGGKREDVLRMGFCPPRLDGEGTS